MHTVLSVLSLRWSMSASFAPLLAVFCFKGIPQHLRHIMGQTGHAEVES